MAYNAIRDDKITNQWISSRAGSEETRNSYRQAMKDYSECLGMTPLQILEEAESEIKAGLLMREREIESHILAFRDHLEKRKPKLASNTIKNRIAIVRSFYKYYSIPLPVLPRSVKRATAELKRKVVPKKEDIQHILRYCDPLEKAIIMVGIASGLSAVDIIDLRIHHIKEGYDPETGVTTIHIIRTKTGFEFHTFLTPEASNAVQDYLNWRNRTGRNDPESLHIKNAVYSDDDYLFIRRYIDDAYLDTRDDELRKYKSSKSIFVLYSELCNKANRSAKKGDYNLIRSHNMRRYFYNKLRDDKFEFENLEYLMAHSVSETVAGYWRIDPKSLREEYIQHMHTLKIQREFDPSSSVEFKLMQEQNEKLSKIAAEATVERDEIIALRVKVAEFEAFKQVFDKQISRITQQYENPATPAEKHYIDMLKEMASNPEYKREIESAIETLPPMRKINDESLEWWKYSQYEPND
jgi:integrase